MAKRKPKRQAKRQEKEANQVGRPTEYHPEFCDIAAETCARGGTIAELADRLGVARWTIYRWMAEHQAFGDAIRIAREIADERVGFSLYERAVGYTYDAVKILQNAGVPLVVPYKEHVPPDVGAAKHWLANRQPDKWGADGDRAREDGTTRLRETTTLEIARRLAFLLGEAMTTKQSKAIDVAGSAA